MLEKNNLFNYNDHNKPTPDNVEYNQIRNQEEYKKEYSNSGCNCGFAEKYPCSSDCYYPSFGNSKNSSAPEQVSQFGGVQKATNYPNPFDSFCNLNYLNPFCNNGESSSCCEGFDAFNCGFFMFILIIV